ncbi:MAG: histidine ammonia-lyase [Armatimonadota bacterium]
MIKPGEMPLGDLRQLANHFAPVKLDHSCWAAVEASSQTVQEIVRKGDPAYGINTGFGKLAKVQIPNDQLSQLQLNLVRSHAVGVGELLDNQTVRLILVLKIASLARGFSGIRREVIEALIEMHNSEVWPCIPCQGSVGASGDLAPLAHLVLPLLGEGEAIYQGERLPASAALQKAGLKPINLGPKEGLALLNGTQVSTAIALKGLFLTEQAFAAAIVSGAMSVDAAKGSDEPFDSRIHEVRGHPTQVTVARLYRDLLSGSEIRESHREGDDRVQDPYSLRCQPQVMGACLEIIQNAARTLTIEANAVSDNPLVFSDTIEVLSGGNFHAEPVAFAADTLALACAEIGSLAERRIALLIDSAISGLPAFLVAKPGLNSGFMIAHVTAAALVSENKTLCHPASIDSIPTSANQEDHVSMATFAARKLATIAQNVRHVIAIELLAAAQGIEFHRPLKTSSALEAVHQLIRDRVAPYDEDRFFGGDFAAIEKMIHDDLLTSFSQGVLPSFQEADC